MNILITAGPVYGRLDDNKLISNRTRGIWAERFAEYLARRGHYVTILVADTFHPETLQMQKDLVGVERYKVLKHNGFDAYHKMCVELAPDFDAAIMAAAVVNWIPAEPVKGKMPTKGYQTGDRINIPFYLAPRVIDEMKEANPKLTLIGCKMLSGSNLNDLIDAAYEVVLRAKCNVVVANDLSDLKVKALVYQDRTVRTHHTNNIESFYEELLQVLMDKHYRTVEYSRVQENTSIYKDLFDQIVDKYRSRFTLRQNGVDRVFGSVAVHVQGGRWLVSPREKGQMFSSQDAVEVIGSNISEHTLNVVGGKATLNAMLMIRVGEAFGFQPILHLHETIPGFPTMPYAPPGTVRDNERHIPGRAFNIEGHGFIACLDDNLDIVQA